MKNFFSLFRNRTLVSTSTSILFFHIARCGTLSISPHYKVWILIYPYTLHFMAWKINLLISFLQCCELYYFPLKLFVKIQHITDMVSSWSGNNTNNWLVPIASLIVQNLIKVMNIMWTFPPHLICKIHHNFRKLVLYLLVNIKQFHYRSFNITLAPFNYLINGTIFRAV